jgi:hypothetical protein
VGPGLGERVRLRAVLCIHGSPFALPPSCTYVCRRRAAPASSMADCRIRKAISAGVALKTAASGPDKDADRGRRSLGSAVALDARIAASARPQSSLDPWAIIAY